MANRTLEDLEKARGVLVAKRIALAKTIATSGENPDAAIKAIIEVQYAIDVIDRAMEEVEESDEFEEDE